MNTDILSIGTLAVVAIVGFAGGWSLVRRIRTARWAWVTVWLFWSAWFVSIFFVDGNIPLSASHFRPSGAPVPEWLAVVVFLIRFGALGTVSGAAGRRRAVHAQPTVQGPTSPPSAGPRP